MRLLWMDRLRGAAILAVLVLHAELSARGATGETLPAVHALNGWLAPYRMPLLVALSGVLLTPALGKPWRDYLSGKLRHLLWPYLVWVTLDTAYAALRAGGLGWDYVARLAYDPRTYLWFLAYLFVFCLLGLALPGWLRVLGGPLLVLGLDGPVPLFVLAVVGSSAVGAVLVQGRRHPGVDGLFAWPAPVRASRREVRTPALR